MLIGGDARVRVDGVDLTERFGVLYTDESVRNPPGKRTIYRSIPGRDGDLDLSEALTDDIVFENRQETMVLYVPSELDFEQVKTDISNFLDGRRLDYSYSFDPGYTLTGRFRVVDYSGWHLHRVEVEVDADPWKRGEHRMYSFRAGAVNLTVTNARRHVSPTFTVEGPCLVEYKGRAWELPGAGTYQPDMRLDEGTSQIYVNGSIDFCNTTWDDLAAKYGRWSDIPKGTRWADVYTLMKEVPDGERQNVVVEYDLYDL